jgi:hypothetical protein
MSEIKFEIIQKMGMLSVAPTALTGTSPKFDIETLNNYQAYTCRIWGRQEGAEMRERPVSKYLL